MPGKPDFCPRLQCEAYDMIFAGLSQPLIGSFCLDLGSHISEMRDNFEQMMQQLDNSCT